MAWFDLFQYLRRLCDLELLIRQGEGDSKKADSIRDSMDTHWFLMSPMELSLMRRLAPFMNDEALEPWYQIEHYSPEDGVMYWITDGDTVNLVEFESPWNFWGIEFEKADLAFIRKANIPRPPSPQSLAPSPSVPNPLIPGQAQSGADNPQKNCKPEAQP